MPDELTMQETARWLRFAKEDLDGATHRQSGVPRHSCLLAQQSAEKAIKSILAFLDLRIPKSHDLDMLKNLLPDEWEIKRRFDDLSELTFWAVESRYPGDLPEATTDDAKAAVLLAEEILISVESSLRKHGFKGGHRSGNH
ncbi:MAG: HEPN domain-containing protein [Armatimonadetes bacterium]|nr:HEPN domain-containing protein [Armatimonadota bacterium]